MGNRTDWYLITMQQHSQQMPAELTHIIHKMLKGENISGSRGAQRPIEV